MPALHYKKEAGHGKKATMFLPVENSALLHSLSQKHNSPISTSYHVYDVFYFLFGNGGSGGSGVFASGHPGVLTVRQDGLTILTPGSSSTLA